ncbi:MAG: DUF4976 domain-containing protein, partial [Chloroflexi bacterium]|nr:DUF4976 domain-containing protein [Chloroflexota bacterium]
DCVEGAGQLPVRTPALGHLAEGGVRFTHAFTPCPCCAPARQSLFCGEWPQAHGGLWNYGLGLPMQLFERPTWSQALAAAGYRLGYVGKWDVHPSRGPKEFGFYEHISSRGYGDWRAKARLPAPVPLAETVPRLQGTPAARWFGGRDPVPVEQARTHWCAERAIELMRRYVRAADPWAIALAFEEPHLPCYPASPFAEMYPPEDIPPWGSFGESFAGKPYIQRQQLLSWGLEGLGWDEWALYVSRYLGMVSQIDDAVGRLLDALDELGAANDTLVIYTSDHGDNCGSHRLIDKHYIMYDDVVRVPLFIRWPDAFRGGKPAEAFVLHALDIAATIYDAAGLPLPETCAGRSLVPLLTGASSSDWRGDVVSVYHGAQFGLYCQRMLRDSQLKYVWNPTDVDELYDLASNPWELDNRIADPQYAEALADMRRRLLQQLVAQGDALVRTDWMRRQLGEGRKLDARAAGG